MDTLLFELKKLGLKENEARVYLTSLESGPSSIMHLAKRAGLTRPTTYEIVARLMERGLFIEAKIDKKRAFVAQSPDALLGVLRAEQRSLIEREREFLRIISTLESHYAMGPAGGIRVYQGAEAMRALEERVVQSSTKQMRAMQGNGSVRLLEKWYAELQARMGNIMVLEFVSGSKNTASKKINGVARKSKRGPFNTNYPPLLIFPDRVIIFDQQQNTGFLIENPLLVSLLGAFFDTLWEYIKE